MKTLFSPKTEHSFEDHPRFAGVRVAPLVTSKTSDAVSVALLDISPGTEIPLHSHDIQADSILVLTGQGQIFVNREWRTVGPGDYVLAPKTVEHGVRNTGEGSLMLFVHHSPPLS